MLRIRIHKYMCIYIYIYNTIYIFNIPGIVGIRLQKGVNNSQVSPQPALGKGYDII